MLCKCFILLLLLETQEKLNIEIHQSYQGVQRKTWRGVVAHAFNDNTLDAEAVKFLWVQGQPRLHTESLSQKTKQNQRYVEAWR